MKREITASMTYFQKLTRNSTQQRTSSSHSSRPRKPQSLKFKKKEIRLPPQPLKHSVLKLQIERLTLTIIKISICLLPPCLSLRKKKLMRMGTVTLFFLDHRVQRVFQNQVSQSQCLINSIRI